MYEHVKITHAPWKMGQDIADSLQWPENLIKSGPYRYWMKPGTRIKKHQYQPGLYAHANSFQVYGLEWMINWFMSDGHLDGIHSVGWPEDDFLETMFDLSGEPGLKQGWDIHTEWLQENPEYRVMPPGVKSSTRENPKDYLISGTPRLAQP